jgi:DNA-directed RNA polymerase specialized sigma24 family protein
MFDRYDPARARFRTFLRTCLDRFVSNERKAERRQKRGGDVIRVPLDWDGAESELEGRAGGSESAEEAFSREWTRSLFELAVTTLKERCEARGKGLRYRIFERYDIEADAGAERRLTYQDLARETGLPATQVTNELAAARRELRAILLEILRDTTGSEAEYREEVRALIGHDPEHDPRRDRQ